MKKLFILVSAATWSLAILSQGAIADEPKQLNVVTTLSVLGELAKEVGGKYVSVQSLSAADQDPHFITPRPTLMKKAREADLFIENGMDLELWADKVVTGAGNTKIQKGQPGRVVASFGVQPLEKPAILSRDFGDIHPYGNPHIWLDPLNTITMANNIAKGLIAIDAAHKDYYQQRLYEYEARVVEALFGKKIVAALGKDQLRRLSQSGRLASYLNSKKMSSLLGGWLQEAQNLNGSSVVTYHKTWAYFANRFDLKIPIEIEQKPGIAPSAKHRDQTIQVMKINKVKVVLMEPFYDKNAAEYVAQKAGAKVLIEQNDVPNGKTYFEFISKIISDLNKANN